MIELTKRITEGKPLPCTGGQGDWFPACGGTERPFTSRSGKRLLYCWQPSTGKHAYLDCGSDLILTQEESEIAMQLHT